jgi:hypothetical protein
MMTSANSLLTFLSIRMQYHAVPDMHFAHVGQNFIYETYPCCSLCKNSVGTFHIPKVLHRLFSRRGADEHHVVTVKVEGI